MQFLGYLLFFFAVLGSTFGATGEKFVKNTLKQQERNEKKCKSLYPKSVNSISKVTSSNAGESVKYFDCTIDYAALLMVVNPRTLAEEEANIMLNNKISLYEEMIFQINAKGNDTDGYLSTAVEETITEKQFIIKKSEDKVISMQGKVETLEQAKRKCEKQGFKEKSFDSLELYLFEKCVKEEGFAYKRPESKQKALKAKQDERQKEIMAQKLQAKQKEDQVKKAKQYEKQKESMAQKLQAKQKEDQIKRKKDLENKVEWRKKEDSISAFVKEKIEIQGVKSKPAELEPVKTKAEVIKQEISEKPIEPEINAIPEEKIVIQTEVKPSEVNKNVTYTKKTICKIDANGSKICTYDPTYKVQGTKPINKL